VRADPEPDDQVTVPRTHNAPTASDPSRDQPFLSCDALEMQAWMKRMAAPELKNLARMFLTVLR